MSIEEIQQDAAEHAERLTLTRLSARGEIVAGDLESRDIDDYGPVRVGRPEARDFDNLHAEQEDRIRSLAGKAAYFGQAGTMPKHRRGRENRVKIRIKQTGEIMYGFRAAEHRFSCSYATIVRALKGERTNLLFKLERV